MNNEIKAWVEEVVIPTYSVGTPEKNPMFLEKRVYQGSSGVVYPSECSHVYCGYQSLGGIFCFGVYLSCSI